MPIRNDPTVGVLVVNLGTPEAPTQSAVRRYLGEFLWDPRVVEMFRPLWWLILNLVILQIRPRISAKAYRKVWTEQGSPLLVNSQALGRLLQKQLELVNHCVMTTSAMLGVFREEISTRAEFLNLINR